MTPQAILVDTNIISYLYRKSPKAESYRAALEGRRRMVSFQSYAELMLWSVKWSSSNHAKLERFISNHYGYLPHSEAVTTAWVRVMDSARGNGYPISAADAWIAATALSSGLLLLTADKNDFLGVDGLKLLAV